MILDIAKLRTDGGTQMRSAIDPNVVQSYAEAMRCQERFPHLTVFHDGSEFWLADGFHRLEAMKLLGREIAVVEAMSGSLREAILFSVGANARHGLRRTNEDKRRAVERILADEEWRRRMSDRWIAEKCAVHHETVTRVRNGLGQLAENASSPRLGKDGKSRRLPTKPEGSPSENDAPTEESQATAPTSHTHADDSENMPNPVRSSQRSRTSLCADDDRHVPSPRVDPMVIDDRWVDSTVHHVLHGPMPVVEMLKIRIENAFAARGLYFGTQPG